MLHDTSAWAGLPSPVSEWLVLQAERSFIPNPEEVLTETFPRGTRHYLVAYPFEGRLAHQTLGMLLTRRLERAGARPLGFVANDYSLAGWADRDLGAVHEAGGVPFAEPFGEDLLGHDLGGWPAESVGAKR